MEMDEKISNSIFDEVVDAHRQRLIKNLSEKSTESLILAYKTMSEIYKKMDQAQKKGFESFLGLVLTDAASIILGGVDGSTDLGQLNGQFELRYNTEIVNGSLQDFFLARAEEEGIYS